MITIFVLVFSIVFQLTAAIMAIRLIRITERRAAWSMISAALFLMSLRRVIPLYHMLSGSSSYPVDILNESIGLALSFIMMIGVAAITPLFLMMRESELRFRTFFEDAPIGKSMTKPDGRLERVNKTLCKLLGYNNQELSDLTLFSVTHPDDIAESQEYMRSLLAGERDTCSFEKRYITKDGSIIWAQVHTRLQRDAKGIPLHLLTHIIDITDRKRAEEALEKSKEIIEKSEREKNSLIYKLNQAQQLAGIGSWDRDLISNTVWWSDETYRIFGVTKQEFTPDFAANAAFIHPDDLENYRKDFNHSLKTGEPLDYNARIIRKDGSTIHCNAKGHVEQDNDGKPIRFVGTITDITQMRMAEEKIRMLNEELERRVIERTAELTAKTAELERINKVFVERELRMRELKDRIAELEKQ